MLFVNTARAGFTLVVISAMTPAFVGLIIPLALVYYWIQRYYLRTSRELKRLDSVSRSPIYAHFQESLGGITTIRAYRQEDRFALENEWRVDANLRAYFPSINANRCVPLLGGSRDRILTFSTDGSLYGSSSSAPLSSSVPPGSRSSPCHKVVACLPALSVWPCRMPSRSPSL
jgi:ABC-type multidrug transport system fused ATPase/permease subunit